MSVKLVATYYSAPNFSIPPPESNGPLHLGSLVADLKNPVSLNPGLIVPISEQEIVRTQLTGFSTTFKDSKNAELGIFARILGLEGLGGELSASRGRSQDESLSIQSLETQYFNPSLEYMNGAMNLQPVRVFRQACRDRLPVYLVTGLKVAKGASASITNAKSVAGTGEIGLMDPFAGAATVGHKAAAESSKEHNMSFDGSSNFVLGYRVTRLKWKKSGTKHKAITSGATLVEDRPLPPGEPEGLLDFVHDFVDENNAMDLEEISSPVLGNSRWVFL